MRRYPRKQDGMTKVWHALPPRWYRQGNSKLESIRFVEQVVSSLDETDYGILTETKAVAAPAK